MFNTLNVHPYISKTLYLKELKTLNTPLAYLMSQVQIWQAFGLGALPRLGRKAQGNRDGRMAWQACDTLVRRCGWTVGERRGMNDCGGGSSEPGGRTSKLNAVRVGDSIGLVKYLGLDSWAAAGSFSSRAACYNYWAKNVARLVKNSQRAKAS